MPGSAMRSAITASASPRDLTLSSSTAAMAATSRGKPSTPAEWAGAMSMATSPATSSGRRSATSMAALPPMEWPTRITRAAEPSRWTSSSATASAIAS